MPSRWAGLHVKTQRLGTCNTLESLVVSSKIAKNFLPKIKKLFDKKNIEIRGCLQTRKIISNIKQADEQDYYEEYLGPIISIIELISLKSIKFVSGWKKSKYFFLFQL